MILPSSQHHPVVIPRECEGENRETNNGTFNLVLPGVDAWRCEIRKTLPWRENPYFDLGTGCTVATRYPNPLRSANLPLNLPSRVHWQQGTVGATVGGARRLRRWY